MKKECHHCLFCEEDTLQEDDNDPDPITERWCHRYPPSYRGDFEEFSYDFPKVKEGDWCGEWQQKVKTIEHTRIEETEVTRILFEGKDRNTNSRIQNAFRRAEIITLSDLISKNENQLLKRHNLGKGSLAIINGKLSELGLSLSPNTGTV